MFNLGAGELLVIAVLALVVLGPERIPSAMRQLGRAMGELRRVSTGFQAELRSALEEEEVRGPRPVRTTSAQVRPAAELPDRASPESPPETSEESTPEPPPEPTPST